MRIGMRQLSGGASSYKLLEIFLQNCDNNTNGGIMDNRKLNRRNLLLLLFVVAACIMGGRSIFGFFALLTGYETAATEYLQLQLLRCNDVSFISCMYNRRHCYELS